MLGKDLKAFAMRVPDEAEILVRERSYGAWEGKFELQAVLTVSAVQEQTVEDAT